MALQAKNYDPALRAGASLDVSLDLGEIFDANNNEILEFDAVASAVNFFRLANSATGNRVVFSTQGDDTNVGLDIQPKGSGVVRFVTATVPFVTTGGAWDAGDLGRSDPVFVVQTAIATPITVTGRTTANTSWVAIDLDSGTRRYIQIYD